MRHYRLAVAEARIVQGPAILETLLGSCVAAVFWHADAQCGAMCHAALPVCPAALARSSDASQGLRYVDYAVRYLLASFRAKGIDPLELQVKLFGGADVLTNVGPQETVGHQNCVVAKRVLKEAGLQVMTSDLGGTLGRVIYLRVDSGEVFVRRLKTPDYARQAQAFEPHRPALQWKHER